MEKRAVITEFGTAVFVVSASLLLKLGIATVALVVSRLYDPFQSALQNLAAIISAGTNIGRMKEIFDYPVQEGGNVLTNQGSDMVFDRVGFAYNTGETVLEDVSFTAKQGQVTALVGPSGGGKTTVSRLANCDEFAEKLPQKWNSMIGENGCLVRIRSWCLRGEGLPSDRKSELDFIKRKNRSKLPGWGVDMISLSHYNK